MIIGDHIILRHLKEDDRSSYHKWINNRDLVHLNSTYRPISEANHNDWFNNISKEQAVAIFSIVEKDADSLIGSCSLRNINHLHKNCELQIRIGDSKKRGKGFGSEAIGLLLLHAFEDLNMERVYLHVFSENERAIKAYSKNGFVKEGVLRKAAYINGAYVDVKVMSVLRENFYHLSAGKRKTT